MKRLLHIMAVSLLAGCSQPVTTDQPTITVTIEPLRYFTEAIAGDKYNVVSMVPAGTSPETYDPTPMQMVTLNKSKAYFQIGYIGFELTNLEKMKKITPQLTFYNMSDNMDLIHEKHFHTDANGHKHSHGNIEPHIWNSTKNAKQIVKNICSALSTMDEENSMYYAHRRDSMINIISRTDSIIRETIHQNSFLIYHPALTYFAREYLLKQISIEKEGKEPSPAHLKELIRECKENKVKTVFVQKEFNTSNALIISEELDAEIVEINPLNYNWQEEMLNIAKALGE